MESFYPIFIAFTFIFVSELGDKTQLLVLSFSGKQKTITILLGVAMGSLLSHGVAIMFGSSIGLVENFYISEMLKIVTYISFFIFGILSIFSNKENTEKESKKNIIEKIASSKLNYIIVIALTIAIGELGDKTFLASIGLGIQYPNYKLHLVIGAILGMVISDSIAIVLGKFLRTKISERAMEKLSGVIFIMFGVVGLISHFI